jgi:hypothetical protein
MANEQTSVPLYAASEVLTAANMNISAGTGVPVFATTVTRDAAFGGASEKVLAEGQLCYLSSTNVVQQYNGSGWETVGPAAAGGLVFIASGTVTAGASLSFDNCFSATYANYLIRFNQTAGGSVSVRLRASGADITAANYGFQGFYIVAGAQTLMNRTGQTSWGLDSAGPIASPIINLGNPFPATVTTFSCDFMRGDTNIQEMAGGFYNAATSADGFTLTGTTITLTARVYGYTNS